MEVSGLTPWISRFRAAGPALSFVGGFLWDAATLGRSIQSLDLLILLAYLLAAGGILVWMGRRFRPGAPQNLAAVGPMPGAAAGRGLEAAGTPAGAIRRFLDRTPALALQFCFGGLFSALVIFYFLSSSYLPGYFLVAGLAVLLGLNEFLQGHHRRFTLSWTLFGVCAILFLNFALPHLFRSISPAWFYVSTALGLSLVYGLRSLAPKSPGSLWPVAAVAALLLLLFAFNFIPPVPLVKKEMIICRELEKMEGRYRAVMEQPPLFAFWRRSEGLVHQRPGEKIDCFTSIFLPPGIECTLYHRWMYKEPKTGKWSQYSRIGFPIRGGRKEGYRGFTYKRNMAAGKWKVQVETEEGRVLGLVRFRVEPTAADAALEFKSLVLE